MEIGTEQAERRQEVRALLTIWKLGRPRSAAASLVVVAVADSPPYTSSLTRPLFTMAPSVRPLLMRPSLSAANPDRRLSRVFTSQSSMHDLGHSRPLSDSSQQHHLPQELRLPQRRLCQRFRHGDVRNLPNPLYNPPALF